MFNSIVMKSITTNLSALVVIFNLWSMAVYSQSPSRAVLIEEFSGEWCGWCPIGMMELDNLTEKYGLKEYSPVSDLIVFPIPAENYFSLKMGNGELISKVQIFSIDGKRVFSNNTLNREIQINSQNFPNGYYIICVETNENIYQGKIIISK